MAAVSTRGAMPLAPSLDTIGLLARGAAEIVPAARVLADLADASADPQRRGARATRSRPRILAWRRACQDGIDADCAAASRSSGAMGSR